MRLDGRRLVRALVLGTFVLVLSGGAVGLAVAAGQQADDERTLTVPAPHPGDRAVYTAREVILDEALARAYDPGTLRIEYEWLPERWQVDTDYGVRLVHPLRSSFTFRMDTRWESTYVVETTYDAATGAPVSETQVWAGQEEGYGLYLTGDDDPGTIVRDRQTRYDGYQGQLGPCGFRVPFQGQAYDDQDFWLQGGCDWPLGRPGFTYTDQGWKRTDLGRVRAFQGVEDPRFFLEFDETAPFPVRATSVLSEAIGREYTYGRYFVLERAAIERGTGTYTPLAQTVFREAVQPVAFAPRTPWTLDDADIVHHFPLSAAYAAALAQAGSPLGQEAPTAAEWLADHPGAYLASATTAEYRDRNDQPLTWWYLAWTDGVEVLGKQVSYGPVGADSTLLPSATGERAEVSDWPTQGVWPWNQAGLVKPEAVPATFPRPADLLARYSALTGDVEPNRYSFTIECPDEACAKPDVMLIVGRQVEAMEGNVYHLNYADSVLRPYRSETDRLLTDGSGQMMSRWMDVASQEAVFPVLGGAPAAPHGPDETAAVAPTWAFPDTPAAATGISLLAAAVSALYYFWPNLKGLVGAGLFSRIEDGKVLDHPTRRRIHDAITSEPGIHFQALARKAGVGRGALDHHLRKLLAADLVVLRRTPGYTCYFVKGSIDRRLADAAPNLRSGGSRAVLQAVASTPGQSSRDLAAALGLAPSTVSYHLKRLEEAGLVFGGGAGAGARLSPLGEQAATSAA